VHDMRVATRRLRAALVLFADRTLAAVEDEAKALQDALGAVREIQVRRAWLRDALAGARGGDARTLLHGAEEGLGPAVEDLRAALGAWRDTVAPTILELSATGAAGGGRLGGSRVAKALRRALAKVERRIDRVLSDPAPGPAHQLRIAAKKLRYLAELAKPGWGRAAKVLLARLEPSQERLGELHDTDLRIAWLGQVSSKGGRRAADALLGRARSERDRQARTLGRDLRSWRDDGVGELLRDAFGRGRARTRARPALARVQP